MLAVPMRSIVIVALGALFSACADYQPPTAVAARAVRTQSLNDLDFGVAAVDYKLTSVDLGTLTLSGDSKLVNLNPSDPYVPSDPYQPSDPYITFTASLSANTRFLAARLDAFQPQDPYCPSLAADYNASLGVSTSDDEFYTIIGDMAANHCNARVLVDLQSATIRAFQPVP